VKKHGKDLRPGNGPDFLEGKRPIIGFYFEKHKISPKLSKRENLPSFVDFSKGIKGSEIVRKYSKLG
jgi:hypothetical protein